MMQVIFTGIESIEKLPDDKKGRIYIDYYSRDDLDRISEILDIIGKQ